MPEKLRSKLILKIAPFSASLLMGLSFTRYNLAWISFVALLPLFYFFLITKKLAWPKNRILLYVWLSGFLFSLINLSWILSIRPGSWASIDGAPGIIGVIFSWLLISSSFSLGWLFFGWIINGLRVDILKISSLLIIPAAWVVGEFLRSWIFSIVILGPGATLGPNWNFGALGIAASATPLVFSSRLIGLFGLGFMVVLINLALFYFLQKRLKVSVITFSIIFLILFLCYGIFTMKETQTINIGLGQFTNSKLDQFPDFTKKITDVMDREIRPLDVLFLPEDSPFYDFTEQQRNIIREHAFKNYPGVVVTSFQSSGYNEIRYDMDGKLLDAQHKNFLIPVGEYVPAVIEGLLKITTPHDEIEYFKETRFTLKGQTPEHPVIVKNVPVSTLACSAAFAPEFYRQQAHDGAQILANIASLDIFSNSKTYFEQAQMMSRFHAVANAKPFVQSAIGGDSFAYSGDGDILIKTKPRTVDFVRLDVAGSSQETPYTRFGETMIPFSIITLLIAFIRKEK